METPYTTKRYFLHILLLTISALWGGGVNAHTRWSADGSTPGRSNADNLKVAPCGNAVRTSGPTILRAGSTVTLNWESTIYHQGYFMVSFSPEDDESFEEHVLIDNIPERIGSVGPYSAEVTLPSTPCDNCTLQLIQVMLDRSPPTNYYSCADIRLVDHMETDKQPPEPVSQLSVVSGLPNLRLTWENPIEDFAGVLILRGAIGLGPQAGIEYQQADVIGRAEVDYVGTAQSAELPLAQAGDDIALYTFDAAYNYSQPITYYVQPELVMPLALGLSFEQVGQPSNVAYAADGAIVVQAGIINAVGNLSGEWSVTPASVVTLESNGIYQNRFDPASLAEESVTVHLNVTDSAVLNSSASASLDINVQPFSYYQPTFALYQQGEVVSQVQTDKGPVELRLSFAGDSPVHLQGWRVVWEHAIPSAVGTDLSLHFLPEETGFYHVNAQVFTPTSAAAEPQEVTIAVNDPILLGHMNYAFCLLLFGLLCIRLFILRRLQHRV